MHGAMRQGRRWMPKYIAGIPRTSAKFVQATTPAELPSVPCGPVSGHRSIYQACSWLPPDDCLVVLPWSSNNRLGLPASRRSLSIPSQAPLWITAVYRTEQTCVFPLATLLPPAGFSHRIAKYLAQEWRNFEAREPQGFPPLGFLFRRMPGRRSFELSG